MGSANGGRIRLDQQKQKVVSNGCSLAAGDEIVSSDIHPVYRAQNEEKTIAQPEYEAAFDLDMIK